MIGFCGLTCTDCPAYLATQAGDQAALEEVLSEWQAYLNAAWIALEQILCDGCQTRGGRLTGYCQQCPMRACAMERSLESCADCAD